MKKPDPKDPKQAAVQKPAGKPGVKGKAQPDSFLGHHAVGLPLASAGHLSAIAVTLKPESMWK